MQRKWHEVMPERWADDPDSDIDDLLPWADGIQKRFAMFEKRELKSAYREYACRIEK